MRIILSEAAHSEVPGGFGYEKVHMAGNQTGDELRTIAYYNYPWKYVLRCKNKDIREACARRSYIATTNMNIGYGQPQREGVFHQLERGIDIANVVEKCDCDCSSLQSSIAWYTFKTQGIRTSIDGHEYTGNIYDHFMKSGWYEDVTSQVDLKTGEGLVMGDILLTPGKHTANVWKIEDKLNPTPKWVGEITKYTTVVGNFDTGELCEWSELGVTNLVDVCDEIGDYYYIRIAAKHYGYVPKSVLKRHEEVVQVGITKEMLNLREKPVNGRIITAMKSGSTVIVQDTVKAENGADWHLVNYNGLHGYCSAKYIKLTV